LLKRYLTIITIFLFIGFLCAIGTVSDPVAAIKAVFSIESNAKGDSYVFEKSATSELLPADYMNTSLVSCSKVWNQHPVFSEFAKALPIVLERVLEVVMLCCFIWLTCVVLRRLFCLGS
jgi:hypothetical protein